MKHRLIIFILSLFVLAACSKLNLQNYDKLELGMEFEEVTQIIGDPASCKETLGTRNCIWGDDEGAHIKGTFLASKAMHFSHKGLN